MIFIGKGAVENVKEALRRAREIEEYNALLSLTEERALERAAKVDAGEISGRLAGVPFVVRTIFGVWCANNCRFKNARKL